MNQYEMSGLEKPVLEREREREREPSADIASLRREAGVCTQSRVRKGGIDELVKEWGFLQKSTKPILTRWGRHDCLKIKRKITPSAEHCGSQSDVCYATSCK